MNNDKVNQLLAEVEDQFNEGIHGPLPYDDCRTLLRANPQKYEDLIPALDLFFSTVAGYGSWGSNLLQWSPEQIHKATENLADNFFEKNPLYEPLLPLVTFSNTPRLYSALKAHESLRHNLLELLKLLDQ